MQTNDWKRTTVGAAFRVVGGGTPSTAKPEFWKGNIPWITSADIDSFHTVQPRRWITNEAIKNSATNLVPKGSIIVVTRVGLGKVALAPEDLCFSQDSQALLLETQKIDPKFAVLQLSQRVQTFKQISRGTTINGELLLPPLDEQQRIVSEIEKQFTRLDAGVGSLKRLQIALKRYRASVLKAACEGRLVATEAELARKENRSYETGEELVHRMLKERREKWNGKGKYKEPVLPRIDDLPQLPQGWTWASLDQISSQITDGEHIQPRYTEKGYPILSAKHVRNGFVVFTDAPLIPQRDFELCLKRCAPTRDDILVVCVGATTGRTAIVGDAEPFALVRSVLLIRTLVNPRYLLAWLQSPDAQMWIQRASGSSAQAHFYIKDARKMAVPLPPLPEQRRIVAELDRRLSVIGELDAAVNVNIERGVRLRQSVLSNAFETGNGSP